MPGPQLTSIVSQAASLPVKAEPAFPPRLDATAHLHQGPATAAPGHPQVGAAFGVVAPAFQVLWEVQDPGTWRARWGWGWGRSLQGTEKEGVIDQGPGSREGLQPRD